MSHFSSFLHSCDCCLIVGLDRPDGAMAKYDQQCDKYLTDYEAYLLKMEADPRATMRAPMRPLKPDIYDVIRDVRTISFFYTACKLEEIAQLNLQYCKMGSDKSIFLIEKINRIKNELVNSLIEFGQHKYGDFPSYWAQFRFRQHVIFDEQDNMAYYLDTNKRKVLFAEPYYLLTVLSFCLFAHTFVVVLIEYTDFVTTNKP